MTRRSIWVTVFLTVPAAALGMEGWASWDDDPDTVPWTWLIVDHVDREVFAFGFGGLVVWAALHFWVRYAHRARQKKTTSP